MSLTFKKHNYEFNISDNTYHLETGYLARQTDSSVTIKVGDCVLLATVVWDKNANKQNPFFPLTVNFIDKYYAGGRFPGGFLKREGRPSEGEILKCRVIDRSIRPNFPKSFMQEVQVTISVLSIDPNINTDIPALIATSAALTLSGLPTKKVIAGVRVAFCNGEYIANPTLEDLNTSDLNLVVSGTADNILMVESEAKEVDESVILDALVFAQKNLDDICQHITKFCDTAGNGSQKLIFEETKNTQLEKVASQFNQEIDTALSIKDKIERQKATETLRQKIIESMSASEDSNINIEADVSDALFQITKDKVRKAILSGDKRIDGRDTKTVRPINIEVGYLPRTHGSAVFTRGETQSLTSVTLGGSRDEQIIDAAAGEYRDRFLLHYNFPPFCTGECGFYGSPKRREIGHGNLAKRSLKSLMPLQEDFPYSVRIVSEILESNGSSSMATVCASSLALMDAGVPLKKPVAGIAMGLIKDNENYAILTDILGDEDHLGDMDFKVAGTETGITALQMDIKISGITADIMAKALTQAKEGRLHILKIMNEALSEHRTDVSQYAPRIISFTINPAKIKDVIGKGGATIREITEKFDVNIDIEDSGSVKISAVNADSGMKAKETIISLTADAEVGNTYEGKIAKILEFGAFVSLPVGKDGFLHISQISNEHVHNIHDILKEGQIVQVKVLEIDRQQRIKLSMKDTVTTE